MTLSTKCRSGFKCPKCLKLHFDWQDKSCPHCDLDFYSADLMKWAKHRGWIE